MMITGERTEKDIKIIDSDTTALLNNTGVSGRTQQMQTEKVYFDFPNHDGVDVNTVTEDFILTAIYVQVHCSSDSTHGSSTALDVYINNVPVISMSVSAGVNGQGSISQSVPIPNWLIKAGTELKTFANDTSYGNSDTNTSFIGYKS